MKTPEQSDLFGADSAPTPDDTPAIECPKCKGKALLTLASVFYKNPGRKYLYWCKKCDTRVGCHKDTTKPLGTPADAELRRERELLHNLIDPIWKEELRQKRIENPGYKEFKARTKFYQRLATAMHLSEDQCHIAQFDLAQCRQAQELVNSGKLGPKNRPGS